MSKPDVQLYLDEARGVYIPQAFANATKRECVEGVDDDTWPILEEGPDHEHYWDAWQDVLDNAVLTDPVTNVRYSVYQDGTCWLIPEGMEWSEQSNSYEWPEENERDNELVTRSAPR